MLESVTEKTKSGDGIKPNQLRGSAWTHYVVTLAKDQSVRKHLISLRKLAVRLELKGT